MENNNESLGGKAWELALLKFPDGSEHGFQRRIGFITGYEARNGEVQTLMIERGWLDSLVTSLREKYEGKGSVGVLVAALEKIIQMNIDQAEHQYGDKLKAENFSCVQVARYALKEWGDVNWPRKDNASEDWIKNVRNAGD